jgi:hypothetical protein
MLYDVSSIRRNEMYKTEGRALCKSFLSCPVISSDLHVTVQTGAGVYSQGPWASGRVMNGQLGRYVLIKAKQIILIDSNGL